MTDFHELLGRYRGESLSEAEKGTKFEQLMRVYLLALQIEISLSLGFVFIELSCLLHSEGIFLRSRLALLVELVPQFTVLGGK